MAKKQNTTSYQPAPGPVPPMPPAPVASMTQAQLVKLTEQQRKYLVGRTQVILKQHIQDLDEVKQAALDGIAQSDKESLTLGQIKFKSAAEIGKIVKARILAETVEDVNERKEYRKSNRNWNYGSANLLTCYTFETEDLYDSTSIQSAAKLRNASQAKIETDHKAKVQKAEQTASKLIDRIWLVDMSKEGTKLLADVQAFETTKF